ncbi:MAG: hypothetical protein J7507_12090 [Pseudoxanthomonas sp.]|nr:hypothetical protein [Pseudoxanthomonas sp.]
MAQRMVAVLNRSDARLAAQLAEALLTMDRDSFTVERLETLLAAVRATNAAAYAAVEAALRPELEGLAGLETDWQAGSIRAAMPPAALLQVPVNGVPAAQAYAAAMARPFQGRLLSGWMTQLAADRAALVRNAVRAGFIEGRTVPEIVQQLRGTKARQYADGLLDRPRRELMTVVRTAVSHTAQTARQVTYDANADLVKAVKWLATLDTRTSEPCRIRDGKQYSADGKHTPIGHKIPWLQGPGRLHFNCRSVDTPVLKSWRELGLDVDEAPAGTRASLDGQVPEDTTYGQWLARQSAARQDEILGPERGALLRAGRVSFPDLYDARGRWLTLAQLRARLSP